MVKRQNWLSNLHCLCEVAERQRLEFGQETLYYSINTVKKIAQLNIYRSMSPSNYTEYHG
jgi:hypothetical protein